MHGQPKAHSLEYQGRELHMDGLRMLSVAIVLVGVSGYAGAQTLVGTTTDPKGIDGVVIDGTTYNVTFSTTPIQSPFETGTTASFTAAAVMAADLSLLGVTGLAGGPPANDCPGDNHVCQQNAVLFVTVDGASGQDVAYCLGDAAPAPSPCSLHNWTGSEGVVPFDTGPLGPRGFGGYGYAANFTVAPEPGTLALLAAGLLGIGFARRKLTS
jgi:hypothetical protein